MRNNILLILADKDFNETEFKIVTDILKKNNFNIFIASDANGLCIGSCGLKVKADVRLYNIRANNFCGIVVIGGAGIRKYWDNKILHKVVLQFNNSKKIIAAICSAPVLLGKAGILDGNKTTCYSEDQKDLAKLGAKVEDRNVIQSGNIITAKDSNASSDFATVIVNLLR